MGRGGSRHGAGRPGWHVKAEHCRRLDVREFRRRKLLQARYFSWSWRLGDEPAGSIGVRVESHRLQLQFSVNGVDASHSVPLTTTPCNFGGSRTWFRCPQCTRQCELLYLRGSRFRCRKCSGVTYQCQSEDAIGRTWRRQRRLEARLATHWSRPKGMHRATYERIVEAILDCEERRDDAIAAYLAQLGGLVF